MQIATHCVLGGCIASSGGRSQRDGQIRGMLREFPPLGPLFSPPLFTVRQTTDQSALEFPIARTEIRRYSIFLQYDVTCSGCGLQHRPTTNLRITISNIYYVKFTETLSVENGTDKLTSKRSDVNRKDGHLQYESLEAP